MAKRSRRNSTAPHAHFIDEEVGPEKARTYLSSYSQVMTELALEFESLESPPMGTFTSPGFRRRLSFCCCCCYLLLCPWAKSSKHHGTVEHKRQKLPSGRSSTWFLQYTPAGNDRSLLDGQIKKPWALGPNMFPTSTWNMKERNFIVRFQFPHHKGGSLAVSSAVRSVSAKAGTMPWRGSSISTCESSKLSLPLWKTVASTEQYLVTAVPLRGIS